MDKTEVKKTKKGLSILEIAATDKENLTSKVHRKKAGLNNSKMSTAKRNKKNINLDNQTVVKNTNNVISLTGNINNNRKDQSTQLTAITDSDLTVDNPSETYWRNLAESCRKALDIALKENSDLHNKVNELEYENSRLKTMLDEAKSLVEVLTEMIEEKSDDPNETTKDDSIAEETKNDDSDSDTEDMSFQSCL